MGSGGGEDGQPAGLVGGLVHAGKQKRTRSTSNVLKGKARQIDDGKRTRVHAQRKFAQGAGGLSPHVSPVKEFKVRPRDNGSSSSSCSSGPTVLQKGERPKTEDFLTFLCLRGTEHLPPELDFFNQVSVSNNGGTSEDSFCESDEDKKDPEVDKTGAVRKSAPRKAFKEKKKVEAPLPPVGARKKELRKDLPGSVRLSRATSRDSASSAERKSVSSSRKPEPRQTRSKTESVSPKNKVGAKSGKGESERGMRARIRGIAKQKDESESSDESSSEDNGGRRSKIEKSESEADADEEASSRESSQRPLPRRSQGSNQKSSSSPRNSQKEENQRLSLSDSKDNEKASVRPSRKTKEAAKNYLNLLGQKLASRRKDDDTEVPLRQEKEPLERVKKELAPEKEGEKVGKGKEERTLVEKAEETQSSPSPPESIVKNEEEKSTDSNGKSPKGEKKLKEGRKEKKDKKKNKTSLKDLQNILLEEAKRKIANTTPDLQGLQLKSTISSSPVDSDTPESEERITISQKTGYISVKPRKSSDEVGGGIEQPPASPMRRNSVSGPNGRRLSKSSSDRTSTPPRKILPKTEEPAERLSESPAASRTNHLPVGVMGAAGLSNRMKVATVAMSKPVTTTVPVSSTNILESNSTVPSIGYSQPLVIQTTTQGSTLKSSLPNSNVAMTAPMTVPQNVTLNVPDPSRSQAVIVQPPAQPNQIRMPLQVTAVPLQVGIQGLRQSLPVQVDVQSMRPAVQVGVRPSTQLGYQSIPILGPSGVQFGIPVQPGGMPVQAGGIPVQSAGMPVQAGGIPLQSANVPVQAGGIPVQSAGMPVQAGSMSVQSAGISLGTNFKTAGLPVQSAGVQLQSVQSGGISGALTAQSVSIPVQSGDATVPSGANFKTAGLPVHPIQQGTVTVQQGHGLTSVGTGGTAVQQQQPCTVPVQSVASSAGQRQQVNQTIVTVPNYIRPTYSYPDQAAVLASQPSTVTASTVYSYPTPSTVIKQQSATVSTAGQAAIQTSAINSMQASQASSLSQTMSLPSTLSQTITVPAGTTIQYNVSPVSIQQGVGKAVTGNTQPNSRPSNSVINIPRATPPTSTPVPSGGSTVISTNNPPLLSPGPPTLSPQISTSSRTAASSSTSSKQVSKLDSGPPMLTPPNKKLDSGASSSHEPPTTPKSQSLLPTQSSSSAGAGGSAFSRSGGSSSTTAARTEPVPTGHRQTSVQYAYNSQHNPYPNMQGVYPPPLQVDPYLSYQQTSPYHQPSPSGSYHSPQNYSQTGLNPHDNPMGSPHTNPMGSPHTNPMGSPHTNPMSSPHANPMSSPHHNPMSSPHHNPMSSPHPNPMSSPHLNPMSSPHRNPMASPQSSSICSPVGNTLASPHHSGTTSHNIPLGSPRGNPAESMASSHANQLSSPLYQGGGGGGGVNSSQQYQSSGYVQNYSVSPVQYNYPSQPSTIQHSPLTPSSSQYRNLQNTAARSQQEVKESSRESRPQSGRAASESSGSLRVKEETKPVPRDAKPTAVEKVTKGTTALAAVDVKTEERGTSSSSSSAPTKETKPEGRTAIYQTKKKSEKFGKSKTTAVTHKPITHFNVDDDKSSPYAFDFDSSDSSPQMPFRKSSSPLKPPAMIKKSKANLAGFVGTDGSQSSMAPRSPRAKSSSDAYQSSTSRTATSSQSATSFRATFSPRFGAEDKRGRSGGGEGTTTVGGTSSIARTSDSLREAEAEKREASSRSSTQSRDAGEDGGSSSDNETTYFIPLQTSGQSFGVAVKLGTDGPSGPNQKVIMTAKLVTNPSKKPMKAKILGSKTTESKTNVVQGKGSEPGISSPPQSTSTPRKVRMPVASPVSPSYPSDANISPISDKPRPRMRRAEESKESQPSTSQAKEPVPSSGRKRPPCLIGPVNTGNRFPRLGQHAQMMEAPTFRPTEAEFQDPIRYIQKIRKHAQQFGMCKIIPPKSFKPECNVEDDLRFTAYNQYINRMFSRWGPNAKETAAIKKYLETQNVDTRAHPLVGGLEVDLPALYHAVQSFGGLSEVIQKKKWGKIAEYLRVARGTHASGNKLDDVYVKWLLPYDTLSHVEREELLRLVEEEWADQSREKIEKSKQREESQTDSADQEDEEEEDDMEAVLKGKSTSLAAFFRLSRNLLSTVFRDIENPAPHEAEDEYWKIVADKDVHMQVCQGSIDTGVLGYGFPVRNSQYASHPWNLKNLTKNQRSILQAMGDVMGVTVPTLHVGMLFTSCCWYRDPHALPWIEYLHTGSSKIWYGIPDHHSLAFYTAMKQLVPSFCKNRKIWLPSDTTMVSPQLLVKHGVSVSRAVQQPGQFLLIFPKSYTSSISTGYCVSESVYFATSDWLSESDAVFQDIRDSMEPMMFPLEKMLFAVAKFKWATKAVLQSIKPKIEIIKIREISMREKIAAAGVKKFERLKVEKKGDEEDDEYECQICNMNLFLSMIANEEEESTFCLLHGLEHVKSSKKRMRDSKFMYTYTKDELNEVIVQLQSRLDSGDYSQEPELDVPLKSEDIEVEEDSDHVEEAELQPRQRSLPTYIKKEKPLISSESDEDDEESDKKPTERTIGPEDYTDFQDFPEEDIPLVEALFLEDDEIIRPSSKRRQPKERKPLTESETEDEDEDGAGDPPKPETSSAKETAKKMTGGRQKKEVKPKTEKRKKAPSETEDQLKKKPKKKDSGSVAPQKEKGGAAKNTKRERKDDASDEQAAKKARVTKSEAKAKAVAKPEESKKPAKPQPKKQPAKLVKANRKKSPVPKEENTRKRRIKKRKAKTMDAADKFNLLDIILTETDDEMPVSASDELSESSSTEDEWK